MLARVARLRRLVAGTDESLAWRALGAGYASQAHMTDEVRRLTGLTPVRFLEETPGSPPRRRRGMPVDFAAAERFILANARLLDRHRVAVLLHEAPVAPVLDALRAYRNPDGGFGHALEPDVRSPASEPSSTLHALRVLAEIEALDDAMVAGAAAWLATIAEPDGGVPFLLPTAADHPLAPFLKPSPGSSFLTCALAGALWHAGSHEPWLARATEWCWAELDDPAGLHAYGVKCALEFLDAVPDEQRARAALERLRPQLDPDGSIPVRGAAPRTSG